jgi:hypothetical protein
LRATPDSKTKKKIPHSITTPSAAERLFRPLTNIPPISNSNGGSASAKLLMNGVGNTLKAATVSAKTTGEMSFIAAE